MPEVALENPESAKETLASHVYDRLRKDIISVAIEPGEKLHIRSLCERFDVGLSPMREALSQRARDPEIHRSWRRRLGGVGRALLPSAVAHAAV